MAKKIALTYDLKDDHTLEAGQPQDIYAELDREETVLFVQRAIESCGYQVQRVGHARNLLKVISGLDCDLVFNICEGVGGRNRESEVPVILDLYQVPFVGSDGLTLGITLDKVMAKKVFIADGVPTPKYFIAGLDTDFDALGPLGFPLMVKPRHEGSSKGISQASIVRDKKALKRQVERVVGKYRQTAIVEEFIRGAEFTVLIIGNACPMAFSPVQIQIMDKLEAGDLVYTSRRLSSTDIEYLCPPKISKTLEESLKETALRAYQAVDCRDFGRVDMRVDKEGNPYVLEINPLPSLSSEDVFPLVAQAHGVTFEELISRIILEAFKRYDMI